MRSLNNYSEKLKKIILEEAFKTSPKDAAFKFGVPSSTVHTWFNQVKREKEILKSSVKTNDQIILNRLENIEKAICSIEKYLYGTDPNMKSAEANK